MASRGLAKRIESVQTIAPQTVTTADVTGTTIDTHGAEGVVFEVVIGTQAGTSNDLSLQSGDASNGSDATDIDAQWLAFDDSGFTANPLVITTANDATTYLVGYHGPDRYVRALADNDTAGNVPMSVNIIKGWLRRKNER